MIDNEYMAAKYILAGTGLDVVDAARFVKEAIEVCGCGIDNIREGIRLAGREIRNREMTVPFSIAVNACLESKAHRRPRTRADIRQLTARMMRLIPALAGRPLRSITNQDCADLLDRCFSTPRQRIKARSILSGIFTIGSKRGWVSSNPVTDVEIPLIEEKRINALNMEQVKTLLGTAKTEEGGGCAAPVGLMVFAGIRPQEVERLKWHDISLQEQVISIQPRHSKTGGARHVTIHPVLSSWLKSCVTRLRPLPEESVCPRNWRNKWRRVRQKAGWTVWQQDCLRHTFASYHVKYFKDLPLLQLEMGHGTPSLLRTRYLNMQGITNSSAAEFWRIKPVRKFDQNNRH